MAARATKLLSRGPGARVTASSASTPRVRGHLRGRLERERPARITDFDGAKKRSCSPAGSYSTFDRVARHGRRRIHRALSPSVAPRARRRVATTCRSPTRVARTCCFVDRNRAASSTARRRSRRRQLWWRGEQRPHRARALGTVATTRTDGGARRGSDRHSGSPQTTRSWPAVRTFLSCDAGTIRCLRGRHLTSSACDGADWLYAGPIAAGRGARQRTCVAGRRRRAAHVHHRLLGERRQRDTK